MFEISNLKFQYITIIITTIIRNDNGSNNNSNIEVPNNNPKGLYIYYLIVVQVAKLGKPVGFSRVVK